MRNSLTFLLLALPLLSRPAAAADAPVAVLGIEASEGAPDPLAAAITDALRQRVSSTKGFRLVPGRDLVEVKLVFSCPDEAPSCMAQAGKSLGASKLIFGTVKKSAGETFVVTLKLLDTAKGVVDAWVAEQINKNQASGPAIRGPVQKWFSSLTGQGAVGVVRVRGDVIGATVALDGTPQGTVGTDDLVLPGVAAGKHEVVVTKPGYEPVKREVTVAAGESAQVEVTMAKSAGAADAPPSPAARAEGSIVTAGPSQADLEDGASRKPLKVATWLVLGGGLVGAALGVYFGTEVQAINKDLDEFRRFKCAGSPTGYCDGNGKTGARPLNKAQQDYVNLKKEDGKRLETFQYISYGVGGALIVTGGYLFYRAYLQQDGERASAPRSRLAVVPVLAPGTAGLSGMIRF